MGFSLWREIGFEKIFLVEGPTEVRTMQQFLRLVGKDTKIFVMPLGGAGMINGKRDYELGELKRICNTENSLYCWIDSEKETETSDLPKDRQEFLNLCREVGIQAAASERRAIENYLADTAIKKVKGDKYQALEYYQRLKDHLWLGVKMRIGV